MKILLVEDLEQSVNTCREVAAELNSDIIIVDADSPTKALNLFDKTFDAAIVDLRLKDGTDGRVFISKIQELGMKIPVVIHTGTTDDIDPDLKVLKTFVRSESNYHQVLDYLNKVYNTGIKGIFDFMQSKITEFYESHFLKNRDLWIERALQNPERVKNSLLRSLEGWIESNSSVHEFNAYVEEFYIPSNETSLYTGTIVKNKTTLNEYIILSPSCDLVIRKDGHRNTNFILLCAINPVESLMVTHCNTDEANLSNSQKKDLEIYVKNNKGSCHWLPKAFDYCGGLIDFTNTESISCDNFSTEFEIKKWRIAPFFVKNILSRFSSYYSRQGQPDLVPDEIFSKLKKIPSEQNR